MPLVVALAGCGGARSSTATKPAAPQIPEKPVGMTTFSFDQQQAPYDVFGEYRIGPGDLLDVLYQVRSWVRRDSFKLAMDNTVTVKFIYAPELNVTQQVRPDGAITLPYLGSVYAVDKSVDEFASADFPQVSGRISAPTDEVVSHFRPALRNPIPPCGS
jgi:polysaccharide export outer membrane protein